jgi:hypothetical protein
MNISLINGVISFIKEGVTSYISLRRVKAEGKITVETAKAKSEAIILMKRAEAAAEWETIQATNSGSSWKDEYWTLLLSIPLFLVFFPQTRPWATEGFEALNHVPEWYLMSLGAAIGAAFGIKPLATALTRKKGA